MALLSSANLFSKDSFRNISECQKDLDHVGPDLCPNCLQRVPADDKSPGKSYLA